MRVKKGESNVEKKQRERRKGKKVKMREST